MQSRPAPSAKAHQTRNHTPSLVLLQITWVRREDWHVLSANLQLFIQDERFRVAHPRGSDQWNLHINPVRHSDNGSYECQVSTEQLGGRGRNCSSRRSGRLFCRSRNWQTFSSPSRKVAIGRLGVKILPAHRVSMLNQPFLLEDSS